MEWLCPGTQRAQIEAQIKECRKQIKMKIFQKLASLEYQSGLFRFYLFYFVFDAKCDIYCKIGCIVGGNMVDAEGLNVLIIMVQNTIVYLLMLALMQQKYDIIIVDTENVLLDARIVKKVHIRHRNVLGIYQVLLFLLSM